MNDEYFSHHNLIVAYLIGLFCYVALGLIGTIILIIIIFLTTSWVYYDAKDLGAGQAKNSWSPLKIALLVLLFWIIALPIFILRRPHIFETAKNTSKLSDQPSLKGKQPEKNIWFILIPVILLIIGCALIAAFMFGMSGNIGSTTPATQTTVYSTGGDQAAIAKMLEMGNWMTPTINVIGDSATSGDYMKMGINAALLRLYIDKNLPEMRRLAEGATTKKASAREFVAYLEDLRTSSDLTVQAADKYNSGDIDGSTDLLIEGINSNYKAAAHLKQCTALL